jgi:hypothetical protein
VLDGHFGNNNVMQMVRQSLSLHLISKLRNDSALYFLYGGPQNPVGRKRIYGAKVQYDQIPLNYLVQTSTQDGIQTDVYQAAMLHKSFADLLNGVIIVKTNLSTQKWAHVVLFSSDLDLAYDKLIDSYQLRFQIEIVFTQMTKEGDFALWAGWDDITDFNVFIVDDDAVDKQFNELATLGEVQVFQRRRNPLAEILNPTCQCRDIDLFLSLGIKLAELLFQSVVSVGQLMAFAFKLVLADDFGQVGIEQTGLLSLKLCDGLVQRFAA